MQRVAVAARDVFLHPRDAQLLADDDCAFLADSERRRVRVLEMGAVSARRGTRRCGRLTAQTLAGGMDKSAARLWDQRILVMRDTKPCAPRTLSPSTPYTSRLASTTPPSSRGFIAHVPIWQPASERRPHPEPDAATHKVPSGDDCIGENASEAERDAEVLRGQALDMGTFRAT